MLLTNFDLGPKNLFIFYFFKFEIILVFKVYSDIFLEIWKCF